ncbi:MAG: hypothetical protein VB010_07080 [Sphaerochaeta associata]|uniref:hypothetical protein n=1 Tax=Sphaerochaeta associata TaxID=1129264 RepID=UPI002B1F8929|nr:hypothetical protein [Sphaerochaeta associata]MEA5107101.1 hypothetical protein [Sphaerochaeta associata]
MAKNDMRIDFEFVDHIKVKRLIRRLGFEGFYSLVCLFSATAKMYAKGDLTGCNETDIEEFAKWDGEPGLFVKTLMEPSTLFLEKREDTYFIHDWVEHQPWVFGSKERSSIASKNALKRWRASMQDTSLDDDVDPDSLVFNAPNAVGNAVGNASSNASSNAPSPSPSPSPSLNYDSDADSVEDCMDKEREIRIDDVDDPIVVNLPLNSGLTFSVHESLVTELTPLYPAVDIREQLLQMAGWFIGNPSKRKTKKGIMRFITNWLSTQQDKASKSTMNPSLARGVSSKPRHYATETGALKTNPHDYNHL